MSVEFEDLEIGDDGTGWVIPLFTPLRGAVSDLIRRLRGYANLNTQPGSFYGDIVDTVTQGMYVCLQAGAEGITGMLFTRARGANLDAVVEPLSTRLPATASTSDLTLYGTVGVNIPAGSQVRVNAVSTPFETDAASGALPAINNSSLYVFEVAEFDTATELGETFTLTVDGTPFTHIVGALDTAQTVVDDLVSQVQGAGLSQGATGGGVSPTTSRVAALVADSTGVVFPISFAYSGGSPLEFLYPAAQVASTAIETGPIVAQTVTLREIVTPVVGWEGVFNINAAEVGREEETDAQLRLRHRANIKSPGASNPDAIRARCLLPVEQGGGGATSCSVEYNKDDVTDAVGNLPHSIRVVVNEGAPQATVAQAIWDTRSAGDNMNGAISVLVDDAEGNAQEVLYDELENIYIWVEAFVVPGEGYSTVGNPLAAIQQDVADYIEALPAGRSVNPIRLPLEVDLEGEDRGIASYTVRIGYALSPLDPPTYDKDYYPVPESDPVAASQIIQPRQKARGDIARVTISTP